VVRRNRQLGLRKLQRLRKRPYAGGLLEDWLVRAGSGVSAPAQTLRYIRWRRGGTRRELLTSVLAPTQLTAPEALALYLSFAKTPSGRQVVDLSARIRRQSELDDHRLLTHLAQ